MSTPNLQDFLTYAGSLPNWKYQLGLAQNQTQQQQLADQLALGQTEAQNQLALGQGQIGTQNTSLADQLQEFLGQLNQSNQAQQFGENLATTQNKQGQQQQQFENQQQQQLESPQYLASVAPYIGGGSKTGTSGYSPSSMGYGAPSGTGVGTDANAQLAAFLQQARVPYTIDASGKVSLGGQPQSPLGGSSMFDANPAGTTY